MSTTPRLGRDGQPLRPIRTAWRFSSDGIQLYSSLWWVAYIAPSAEKPGQWWWKTTACGENPADSGPCGYAATTNEALVKVREALAGDRLYDYTLPKDYESEALMRFELLKARPVARV